MLRVYRSISSFKGQSSFSTWVYRITMNTCLDELRRGKRRKASSLDERIDAGWAPVDDMDTPEHHAMRSEQRRALERAIQELPEDMRSAVVLRDIQAAPTMRSPTCWTPMSAPSNRASAAPGRNFVKFFRRKWNFLTGPASKWVNTSERRACA